MSASFRLEPWEHRGATPAPWVQLEARVEGAPRRFDVKTRDDRVYFRLSDEDDARVWTLLQPLGDEPLETYFRREVEANRVARFFQFERGFSTQNVRAQFQSELKARFHSSNLHLFGPTTLAVAVDDEGNGRAQEWCGGDWFSFALPARSSNGGARKPSIWSRSWNAAGVRRALAPLAGDFAFHPFSPDAFGAQPLHFACGSQHNLERLFRALCVLVAPQHALTNSQSAPWLSPHSQSSSVRFKWNISAQTTQSKVSFYAAPFTLTDELLHLFLRCNLPVGASWKTVDYTWLDSDENGEPIEREMPRLAPNKRIDFAWQPHTINFESQVATHPSAHERLEAHLTLREFLSDKWPRDRIAALLD